ncbi:Ser/Thr protein kinase RdoA (MazF antagonist) [Streptomyces sp. 3330]|uniref:phosphotransferase n=1 Tax=Streptomyces sp. 3330 TaxID=2817755 RepID=UPI002858A6EA|nr:phosphotransferase [Streptomyces sp. 3330]MDR6980641.1 Ser/Thr protein kinase RdoA (MazF antagonist) [Streptomyces sp. 3330]
MPRSCVPPLVLNAPPLGALLRRYAAGTALTCEPVDEGLLNRGYRLRTTRGRYFLKHHFDPDTADPASIARQHRATERLADLGVPVAPPLPGHDGRTVAVVGGHAYALHPWIEGRHRHGAQLTPGQCGRLGALLGVVHASLEQVMRAAHGELLPPARGGHVPRGLGVGPPLDPPPTREPETAPETTPHAPERGSERDPGCDRGRGPGCAPEGRGGPPERPARAGHPTAARRGTPAVAADPAPSPDPADTFVLIDDLLARVRRHHPADSFDELARHRLLERRALLERHADRRPPHSGPVGWVHGDFHPFNLLYRGDAPAAIVDWDRLGVQPRAEEAVRAAAIFFVRPDGTLDLPKARQYARAYRRAAGATPSELAAAVHRVWWERLNDFWMLRWHYERGDTRADSQFPAASALAVWWTREYDAVCGAFAD